MKNVPTAKTKGSTHVPGPYLGYSLQTSRCLARLLSVPPGSYVSVEVFDDVGVIHPDGSAIAEQDKSALTGNPVSDRAVDLWKTFSNWIDAILSGEIEPTNTYFEIFVTPPRTGPLVKRLHLAETSAEAEDVLATLKTKFWGNPPTFSSRAKLPSSMAPYINNVLEHHEVMLSLIPRFQLVKEAGDCHNDARVELQKRYPGDAVGDIHHFALGWVKAELDNRIGQGKPGVIEADVFREQLYAFVRKTDPRRVLRCFASEPTAEQLAADRAIRTYVRQLDLVECDHSSQVAAIIDFFKAATNRTIWSKKGWVGKSDLQSYASRLTSTWSNLRMKHLAMHKDLTDEEKGRVILADCLLFNCQLTEAELPDGFTRGSFHALADSLEIGWHPSYKQKFEPSDG